MDSNRSSYSVICCGNCNKNLDQVYTFPCTHLFCLECTNKMKKGSETTCITCSKKCHQDEIKIQVSINQFGSLRSEYSGDSRSLVSLHSDEVVVDKTAQRLFCSKHNEDIKIYCEDCDVIVCTTCCIINHSGHAKSDEQEKVLAKSNSDINNILSKIDNVIMTKNNSVQLTNELEINCLQKYETVRKDIKKHAVELLNHITNKQNYQLKQIKTIETNMVKSVRNNLKESNDSIDLMIEKKEFYTNVIKYNLKIDVIDLNRDLNTINCVQDKLADVTKIQLFLQKPTVNQVSLTEILDSFKFDIKEEILKLKDYTVSPIVLNNKFYTVNYQDNLIIIDIYDADEMTYSSSINFKPNLETYISDVCILNTETDFFIYCRLKNSTHTHIFKSKDDNKTFVKVKTLKDVCEISATFQQTLLVRNANRELIELSADGEELKTIIIPIAAEVPFPNHFTTDHQLKDMRYVVTSYNLQLVLVSLLEADGTFIISFFQQSTADIATCTDGENYVFVLERDVGNITVLSTDLQYLHKVKHPGVMAIFHDKLNDKLMLVKRNEIVYIKTKYFMCDS